jgi:hypothetical protein
MYQAQVFVNVNNFLIALTKTLAFYVTELIKVVKSFMIQAPGAYIEGVQLNGAPLR